MQDDELIQMAVFRLQECSRRVAGIAKEAKSVILRRQLRDLARHILEQLKYLEKGDFAVADPDPEQSGTKRPRPDKAIASERRRERARAA